MKQTIVISAVNLIEGGTLSILRQCLALLSEQYAPHYHIIALVHDRHLCEYSNIEYIEIPQAKSSWLKRLYYEYIYFKRLSKRLQPYLWFSLHDITPNVCAKKRAVYCHNSTPFYGMHLKDIYFAPKVFLFSAFYKFLYRINIKQNSFVVVQQNWIREAFSQMYKIPKNKIIVAYPERKNILPQQTEVLPNSVYTFFYPALARPFKNFEVICEASKLLLEQGEKRFQVLLTIDGRENKYSEWVVKKYSQLTSVKFIGLQTKEKVENYYQTTDCLLFPSQLETWGLPISEFATYNKPMLIADLRYARETASGSKLTYFFNPNNAHELAQQMLQLIQGNISCLKPVPLPMLTHPFVQSWSDLFEIFLSQSYDKK